MSENKDSKPSPAQHELDENKNPSSLNNSLSNSTVNDSFKRINSESDKKCPEPESLCSSGDTLICAGLSTSQKNALVDSGFHCENLDKIAPDLVNSSLCDSVDNQLANDIHEEKQVSTTSGIAICSSNDNSLIISTDSSFNTLESTTTNISLLFERLTLNSAVNAQSAELSALPDNLAPSEASNNQPMPTEVPLNDNFQQANLFNVDVNSNGSNTNISVSPNKSLQQPHLPDLNHISGIESKVPLNETFDAVDVSMNTNVVSLDTNASEITNSSNFSKTSLDDVFKCPLPVPESSNVPNINTSFDDVFPVETEDNLDGEEFQDAVQFFKDPSSFQVFENIGTSTVPGSNMPRDSLYMNFDPLYKRVIQPTDAESVNVKDNAHFDKESIMEEICEMNDATNNHVMNKHARESLGIKLVSFDSPIKINTDINSKKDSGLNIKCAKEEVSCKDNVENDQHLLDKQVLEPKSPGIKLECNLSIKSSSETNSEKDGDLTKESFKEGICNVENTHQLVNKYVQESLGINLVSFDSLLKNNSAKEDICSANNVEDGHGEINKHATDIRADTDLHDELESNPPLKSNSDENSEKDSGDLDKESVNKEISEEDKQIVNKHLARESLGDNLLSFDSPIKCSFENVKTSSENEHKLYTEEEFQQALKIYELTLQEAYLKRQKSLEEEALKQGSGIEVKLDHLTKLCKVLLETVTDLASVASEQNVKIGELSTKVKNLESENEELSTNLKTTTEDLQSVENTFSDFHKRYVQSKDMLKTYKDNEDQLKVHIENLSKKLEEQKQMNAMLQVKMGEMVDKANAEVATAKKGGDAQLAVLKAQLKKSELKVSSLENDLKQTRIENDKLSGICDELMAKVSEA